MDSLSASDITRDLQTRFVGQRVLYYPSLTSTMEVARREALAKAPEGTAVVTDEQTAGKGRLGRTWLSPQGSISLSVILYPAIEHLPCLIMLASLAVVHSIEQVTSLKPQIKWPNDVLVNGRKVCGILSECDVRGNVVNYAIIGIGVNVNLNLAGFPEVRQFATSLSNELGKEVSRLGLIRSLLVEIERLYLALPSGDSVYEEWRARLVTLGKKVRVKSSEAVYEGVAESVARDGSLLVKGPDGNLARVVAGDVTLRDE
ncbi:MAG: biotin--[acetyl-CoA-carboxylase] ligase [Chloroflexi bacterium]|nr:biotin--[acetyl-CoA-carboxylase] ligase [Chloroflexota bacterium]